MKAACRLFARTMHPLLKFNCAKSFSKASCSTIRCKSRLSRSHDITFAVPSAVNRASCISTTHVPHENAPVWFRGGRRCHLAAVADSSSATAAEQQQPAGSSEEEHAGRAAGPTADLTSTSVPSSSQAEVSSSPDAEAPEWSAFLQQLWQRGYFEQHSPGKDM